MKHYDVKVVSLELRNVKNVRYGKIDLDLNNDDILDVQVVGLYGQNGSGKTAVVEAFSILQLLLNGQELPSKKQRLIYDGQESLSLVFEFILQAEDEINKAIYHVELEYEEERMVVKSEKVKTKGKSYGKMFSYTRDESSSIELRQKPKQEVEVVLSGIKLLSQEVKGSLFFSKIVSNQSKKLFSGVDLLVYIALKEQFAKNLLVIKNLQEGVFPSYLFNDFTSKPVENSTYNVKDAINLSKEQYKYLSNVIERNNVVISSIIPDLNVHLKNMGATTLPNGEEGVRAEFLSEKGDTILPLSAESAGTLKLFAITTSLIAAFHNSSACVIIDELDAGVFEYLLGELVEIFQEHSKGQLIFTSHNLRVLEKLLPQNIWFTTTNEENRYIKFKKLQKNNNMRNVYLRTVLVGGQSEFLYEETNPLKIIRSFIEAGIDDGE
ncbi:ATP-binding protein [Paenibacillus sp. HWE-109]|uniref:AAA family ATPase n=1 Tax=Paenibacillus sp. HWE-109 TaxID=1306526 RepID=UPI001EDF2484|nr:ATP-binding protein [Paenibacillus sp. HWE-109]UKS24999.1 ATP-binding protein [Paenibacillus sp. HWE-109]